MSDRQYIGRAGLQQRVIPAYRAAFFEELAKSCTRGLGVFAGEPLKNEGIEPAESLKIAQYTQAENRCFRDPGSSLFLCWQGGLITWLKEWQPDVLIVEANPRYLATRMAISWMHKRGRKVVGWGLGAPNIGGPLAKLRTGERLNFLHSLDAVVAYSQLGAEQYRKLSIPAERVYVASNAAILAPPSPLPVRASAFDGKATVLFVGRMQARKRLDLLIQACAQLAQDIQPRLLAVGDGPARKEVEALARKVYPDTEFVGAMHGDELEPYFSRADLFVLPGTGGLAIQQAMAHALPVIVAQGDGTQDDLVRSENGWQITPDDVRALSTALRKALSDPVRLRRMGEASFRIVKEEINVNKMVEVFIKVMNDLHQS